MARPDPPTRTEDANGTAFFWLLIAIMPCALVAYTLDWLIGWDTLTLVASIAVWVGAWLWLCHRDGLM